MTAIATRPPPLAFTGRHFGPARPRRALPSLGGLALIAVLLPLRGNWAAGTVLALLSFTVPGVVMLRAARVPAAAVRSFPLYLPAASVLVMLTGGLLADLAGPPLGIAKPLHGDTAALTVLGLALVLWAAGIPAPDAARLRWRDALQDPVNLVPFVIPALSAAGALLLTHGDGVFLARAAGALAVIVVFGMLLAAPRLTRAQAALLLFACALAVEWAFSLRGQEVVGFDISSEITVAQHTLSAGIWHPLHRNDAYGAMLSLSILPSVLHALTGCAPVLAFKLVYPVLTALLPASVFLLAERLMTRRFAVLAGVLLLVQDYFFQQLPQLARQEIGLLFFMALIGALLDRSQQRASRVALAVAFSAGLVVSHYSSTYLAVPAVGVALVLAVVAHRWRRTIAMAVPLACSLVILAGGSALWYGTITHSSSNLTSFFSALETKGLNLLPNSNGNIISSYFDGNLIKEVNGRTFQRLAGTAYRGRTGYIHPLPAAAKPAFDLRSATVPAPALRLGALAAAFQLASILVGQLMLVMGVIGSLMMLFSRRASRSAREVGILALSTVGVLTLIRFSGTISADYNQTRALLQSLLLLALPAAWLAQQVLARLGRLRTPAVVAVAAGVAATLAYQSSLSKVVTGGGTLLAYSHSGEDYEREYMTPAELAGASWASSMSRGTLLYADPYGQLRLSAATGATALNEVTPRTLDRRAWLYGTHTNVVLGRARGTIGDHAAAYHWPSAFLNTYFDTVFTDGDSKVYHR
jgi:uncharacterized membrane protein